MNNAKSTPFAYNLRIKSLVSPLSSQKTHTLANYVKFANHFSIWVTRNGNPKFLQQIAQNPLNLPTPTANHAKLAQFTLISSHFLFPLGKNPTLTANYPKSA